MAGNWTEDVKMSVKFPKVKLDTKATKAAKKNAGDAFGKGLRTGMESAELEIKDALKKSLESTEWGPFNPKYPYTSRGGNFRGAGNRSLVDTGELESSLSLQVSFLKTKGHVKISYNSPYAAITHYGGVIQPYGNPRAEAVVLPARPWVQYAMIGGGAVQPVNLQRAFSQGLSQYWG